MLWQLLYIQNSYIILYSDKHNGGGSGLLHLQGKERQRELDYKDLSLPRQIKINAQQIIDSIPSITPCIYRARGARAADINDNNNFGIISNVSNVGAVGQLWWYEKKLIFQWLSSRHTRTSNLDRAIPTQTLSINNENL